MGAAVLGLGVHASSPADSGRNTTVSLVDSVVVAQTTPQRATAEDPSIRPFKVQVPQAALDDLRRRIAATRWPDKETVDDPSQGAQLAKL